jgi:hypothetical protein
MPNVTEIHYGYESTMPTRVVFENDIDGEGFSSNILDLHEFEAIDDTLLHTKRYKYFKEKIENIRLKRMGYPVSWGLVYKINNDVGVHREIFSTNKDILDIEEAIRYLKIFHDTNKDTSTQIKIVEIEKIKHTVKKHKEYFEKE